MSNLKWELLSSEYIYRAGWFTARKDVCQRADGKIIDPYFVLEYPDWVTALAITEDNQVLLIRQYRHAYGEVIVEIPGGGIDKADLSPLEAIRRELLEETGYTFEAYHYLGKVSPNPSTNSNITHLFLATGGTPVAGQSLDENEEIEVFTCSLEALKEMLRDNQIIQSLHISCIQYGLRKLGEGNW
jgi:ADP-ribose pyrophosphatase